MNSSASAIEARSGSGTSDGVGGAGLQVFVTGDDEHLGRDAFGRRSDGHAEAEHGQVTFERIEHAEPFAPAGPLGRHDPLGADVLVYEIRAVLDAVGLAVAALALVAFAWLSLDRSPRGLELEIQT